MVSLAVILVVLAIATVASLVKTRNDPTPGACGFHPGAQAEGDGRIRRPH